MRMDVLDNDSMRPSIAEVVHVGELHTDAVDSPIQPDTAIVLDLEIVVELRIRLAVRDLADPELVEVVVEPAHCKLDERVQLRERDVARDIE